MHKTPNYLSNWAVKSKENIPENTWSITSFSVFWELEGRDKGKPLKAIPVSDFHTQSKTSILTSGK